MFSEAYQFGRTINLIRLKKDVELLEDLIGALEVTPNNSGSALYPLFTGTTSGQLGAVYVDNGGTPLTYVPSSGTLAATVFSGSFSGNGALITNLDASNIATGTANPARLGSGTPNSTKFLRGDSTWAAVSVGGEAPDIATASAVANPPGSLSTEGISTSLARSDHTHELAAFGTSSGTFAEGNDSRIANAVQTSRQIANGTGITGGGDLTADRTIAVDTTVIAEKTYVDATVGGLLYKPKCRAVSTADIPSRSGTITVDDVALIADDRILLVAQDPGTENGPWIIKAGAWIRPSATEFLASAAFPVSEGTVNKDTVWYITTNDPIVMDATVLEISKAAFTVTSTGITDATTTGKALLTTTTANIAFNLLDTSAYQTLALAGTIEPSARRVVFTGTTYDATLSAIGATTATQVPIGAQIWLTNSASGTVTVKDSSSSPVIALLTGTSALIRAGASANTWIVDITAAGMAILDDAATSNQRTTLGLGNSATLNVGTTSSTVAAGDDSRITGALQLSSNLSDLASIPTALDTLHAQEYQTLSTTGTINPNARRVVFTGTTYNATLSAIGTTASTQTPVGAQIWLTNNASGTVTVKDSASGTVIALATGTSALIRASSAATTWAIIITAAGMAILDDASVSAQITTLGLDNTKIGAIGFAAGDNSTTISTGLVGYVRANYAGTVTGWSIICGGSSPTCTIDVWKIATGTALPTITNTITAAAKPALATGNAINSTTLTAWTTAFAVGDIFAFNIDALSNATFLEFKLHTART